MKPLPVTRVEAFQTTIRSHYQDHSRQFRWRGTDDPYEILVSEFMLQQTQVQRVASKYDLFLKRFPSVSALAAGPLNDVLGLWSGLGYNRRALAVFRTANIIANNYAGVVPDSPEELVRLPGIGPATAGAICAFAHNQPVVFIETNIRRVFIHFFFRKAHLVKDKDILPLVDQTLDRKDPRNWYYALMDLGSMLKEVMANPNRKSAHYKPQGPFENSDRQIRGMIIRCLLSHGALREDDLARVIGFDRVRTKLILQQLLSEGFLASNGDEISVAHDVADI